MHENTAISASAAPSLVVGERSVLCSPSRSRTKSLDDMSPCEESINGRLHRRSGFSGDSLDLNPRDIYNTVSRTLHRTHESICRSRFVHLFYVVLLILYTFMGASIFQALDGEFHDDVIREYNQRCDHLIQQNSESVNTNCSNVDMSVCVTQAMQQVSDCFREWHNRHQRPTLPMSDYYNALVYAFSVYTTVGYGNVTCEAESCKYATILYAIIGIPLFFAFLSDISAVLSQCFIRVWSYCGTVDAHDDNNNIASLCCLLEPLGLGLTNQPKKSEQATTDGSHNHLELPVRITIEHSDMLEPDLERSRVTISPQPGYGEPSNDEMMSETTSVYRMSGNQQYVRNNMTFFRPGSVNALQRRVFCAAVLCFVVYLLVVSALLCFMEDWSMFTSFYFLFTSVALIGFGDVFPEEPKVVLVNCAFIVTGIALFGMCYFILQEEIRDKAYRASTHAGRRLSKYKVATQKWLRPSSRNQSMVEPRYSRTALKRRRSAPATFIRSLLSVNSMCMRDLHNEL